MSFLNVIGLIILIVGIFLFIGNVSRAFPTFPLAGWATMAVGGIIMRAGRNA